MKCPYCGGDVPDNSKFCGKCGSSINMQNQQQGNPAQNQQQESPAQNQQQESPAQNQQQESPAQNQQPGNPYQNQQPGNPYQNQQQNGSGANPNGGFGNQNPYNAQNSGAYQNQAPYSQPQPANDFAAKTASLLQNKRSLIILGGIAAAVLVVIILAIVLIFGGSKYSQQLDDIVDLMNDRSTDVEDYYYAVYGDLCGEFKYEEAKLLASFSDDDDEWLDDLQDDLEDTYDRNEDNYGKDWEMDYEITRTRQMSSSEIDDYLDHWYNIDSMIDDIDSDIEALEYSDYSEDEIDELTEFYEDWIDKLKDMEVTDGYIIKVKISIEGDDDHNKRTLDELMLIKVDGHWVSFSLMDAAEGLNFFL